MTETDIYVEKILSQLVENGKITRGEESSLGNDSDELPEILGIKE